MHQKKQSRTNKGARYHYHPDPKQLIFWCLKRWVQRQKIDHDINVYQKSQDSKKSVGPTFFILGIDTISKIGGEQKRDESQHQLYLFCYYKL